MMAFPEHADFVNISAGIHGVSTAWKLANRLHDAGASPDLPETAKGSISCGRIIFGASPSTNSPDQVALIQLTAARGQYRAA